MNTRRLGANGPAVSALGLGCMGMSAFYGSADDVQSAATIERALELGCTFLDTSDVYGPHTNEVLVGKTIAGRRNEVFLATKFATKVDPDDPARRPIDGSAPYVHAACDASLRWLGVDHIDLYYQPRVDPATPIEETVGAMAELVAAGKVRHLGLSEASAATIRRAHAVHPIAVVQSEYSLWTRDPEEQVLPTLRELGISLVACSPLGCGFLAGRFASPRNSTKPTFAGTDRASPAPTSRPTARSRSGFATSRRRAASPPGSSRWPGCWRRARTSCRFPAPGGGAISRRTSAPWR